MYIRNGETAIIAGACGRLGAQIARILAAAGGQVIAIGEDEAALIRLARASKGTISHLRIPLGDTRMLDTLGNTWGNEPLHVLINASPLVCADAPAGAERITVQLMHALQRGLAAGAGRVITLVPALKDTLENAGHDGAVRAMHAHMAQDLGKSGGRANLLVIQPGTPHRYALRPALALIARSSAAIHGAAIDINRPQGLISRTASVNTMRDAPRQSPDIDATHHRAKPIRRFSFRK